MSIATYAAPIPVMWPVSPGRRRRRCAAAALGSNYRRVGRTGAAGCIGLAALDSAMLIAVPLAVPAVAWPLILAATASAVRVATTARTLRPLLTG